MLGLHLGPSSCRGPLAHCPSLWPSSTRSLPAHGAVGAGKWLTLLQSRLWERPLCWPPDHFHIFRSLPQSSQSIALLYLWSQSTEGRLSPADSTQPVEVPFLFPSSLPSLLHIYPGQLAPILPFIPSPQYFFKVLTFQHISIFYLPPKLTQPGLSLGSL